MSCGLRGPSISGSPAWTCSPSCTLTWTPRGTEYSRSSAPGSSGTMMILRSPLTVGPYFTMPSISLMTAGSRGLRASNSSTTRGRPPVMSLVLVVSRGIFASTWPGSTVSPSLTIRCARDGMWYLRRTVLPSAFRISTAGCFFSSGESTMM